MTVQYATVQYAAVSRCATAGSVAPEAAKIKTDMGLIAPGLLIRVAAASDDAASEDPTTGDTVIGGGAA